MRLIALSLTGLLTLSACGERDIILPGQREAFGVIATEEAARAANEARAISLPAARVNADWPQRAGNAVRNIGHVVYSGTFTPVWSVDIGAGETRRRRITADPVVAGGVVYTIDAAATVQATSTSGQPLWTSSLVPATESARDASGGGLAFGAGRVFATNGFGRISALDPATGAVIWTQKLDAPGGAAPTVAGDLVYVASRDGRGWALEVDNGRIRFSLDGAPSDAGFGGGPGVAVNDELAIIPYPSGQILAAFRNGGLQRWSSSVSGERAGRAAAAAATDVSGDPVISGSRVYAGNASGRLVAVDIENGDRIWTAREGALSPVVVAGGSVFLVSDLNELVRLDAATGSRIWGTQLPTFRERRPGRQRSVFSHYGPVLASGRLIVASSDGALRAFDPVSGGLVAQAELPGGAASNPVIAGGTLYVVNTNGQLIAYR